MSLLRNIALLALAGATPLAAHANTIPAGAAASTSSVGSAKSPSLYGITRALAISQQDGFTAAAAHSSIFASGPAPVGDANWSLRPFSLTGETIQSYAIEVAPDAPSPTPEPAGLFLLGTGAFATALSIRYRLFSL